ncbi:unnamed protein product, partial [Linum tenue]
MAQFTAQGRLKLLFNSDGIRYKLVGGAFGNGFRSFQLHKGKLSFLGSGTTKLHVFSTSENPRTRSKFYAEARLSIDGESESGSGSGSGSEGEGGSYDDDTDDFYETDFDTDELACFRGLVLDISYRTHVTLSMGKSRVAESLLEMTVNRAMLVTASQLASYDQFKETILEKGVMSDGLGTHVTASFTAGFVAAVVLNPVDVIKNPTPLGPLQLQLVQIGVEDHLRHYHNSDLHVAPVLQRHRGSFGVGGVLADDRLLPGGDVH